MIRSRSELVVVVAVAWTAGFVGGMAFLWLFR
jgi:nitrogen fixation-related uncharacterized protein